MASLAVVLNSWNFSQSKYLFHPGGQLEAHHVNPKALGPKSSEMEVPGQGAPGNLSVS